MISADKLRIFLCAVSVPVNLLKAFDFEEAVVATGLMFLLGVSGEAFRVRSREFGPRHVSAPVIAFLALGAMFLSSRVNKTEDIHITE